MIRIGVRGVRAAMEPRLRSLTARGTNGCKKSSRNWSNSLTLAHEFSRSNRGKQSTAPDCMASRRFCRPFASATKTPSRRNAFAIHSVLDFLHMTPTPTPKHAEPVEWLTATEATRHLEMNQRTLFNGADLD